MSSNTNRHERRTSGVPADRAPVSPSESAADHDPTTLTAIDAGDLGAILADLHALYAQQLQANDQTIAAQAQTIAALRQRVDALSALLRRWEAVDHRREALTLRREHYGQSRLAATNPGELLAASEQRNIDYETQQTIDADAISQLVTERNALLARVRDLEAQIATAIPSRQDAPP